MKGSESSRALDRRLRAQEAGLGLTCRRSQNEATSQYAMDEFLREQLARVTRVFDRSVRRVEDARKRTRQAHELVTKQEAVTGCITVRGSCGSDVHLGSDE